MKRRGFLAALPAVAAIGKLLPQEERLTVTKTPTFAAWSENGYLDQCCWVDVELADDEKLFKLRPVSPVRRFMQAVKEGEGDHVA